MKLFQNTQFDCCSKTNRLVIISPLSVQLSKSLVEDSKASFSGNDYWQGLLPIKVDPPRWMMNRSSGCCCWMNGPSTFRFPTPGNTWYKIPGKFNAFGPNSSRYQTLIWCSFSHIHHSLKILTCTYRWPQTLRRAIQQSCPPLPLIKICISVLISDCFSRRANQISWIPHLFISAQEGIFSLSAHLCIGRASGAACNGGLI